MARIMVIDDDAFVREDLRGELRGAGHEVAVYSGGEAALAAIEAGPPELVITDIVMKEGEGMQLISQTKERWPDVVVIAISSNREYLKYAAAFGAHHCLHKPIRPQLLLAVVEAH
jgi:DNA-binding NtrC family response regulator